MRELEAECVKRYIDMLKQKINIWKIIIKASYLMCLDASNLYGWLMSQKLPVNGFKWVKKVSKFNDTFTKKNNEKSNKGYFLEGDAEYPKNLFNLHNDFTFLPEKKNQEMW